MSEHNFVCPTCDEKLTFVGDINQAEADCPKCGPVWLCPDELYASADAEARMDAARDDRLERDHG